MLFKSENSRPRDVCFSKVLVCLFKVQKRLVYLSSGLVIFKSVAKVILFFYIAKCFYMFFNIILKKSSNFIDFCHF